MGGEDGQSVQGERLSLGGSGSYAYIDQFEASEGVVPSRGIFEGYSWDDHVDLSSLDLAKIVADFIRQSKIFSIQRCLGFGGRRLD